MQNGLLPLRCDDKTNPRSHEPLRQHTDQQLSVFYPLTSAVTIGEGSPKGESRVSLQLTNWRAADPTYK